MGIIQIQAPNPVSTPEQVIPAINYNLLWLNNFTADFPTPGQDGTISVRMQQYGTDVSGNVYPLTPGQCQIAWETDNVLAQSYSNPLIASGINSVLTAIADLLSLQFTPPS